MRNFQKRILNYGIIMDENTAASSLKKSSVKQILQASAGRLAIQLQSIRTFRIFRNKKMLSGLGLLLAIVVYFVIRSLSSSEGDIPTYKVKRGSFLISITESGELRAKNSLSVYAPRLRSRDIKLVYLVPEGTYVKQDDIIAKLDPTEALNSLKDAESKLEIALSDKEKLTASHKSQTAQMETDLRSAELTFQLSKLNMEQIKFEAEVKQQQAKLEHQKNELSYNRTKQDVASKKIIQQSEISRANIEVKQRKADLERAQNDLELLSLKAPGEGLVVYEANPANGWRKVSVGDNVIGGYPIVTLPDLSTMESITSVNEVDISRVKKGEKVQVRLDAFQDSLFEGSVAEVASLGRNKDYNSNIKVFQINVAVKGHSPVLKPGMTTSNRVIINEIPNVLFVPQECVFEKNGRKVVYIKNGSGFDETAVETGDKSENYVVIKKGLPDNAVVALIDPTLKPEELEKSAKDESGPSLQSAKSTGNKNAKN